MVRRKVTSASIKRELSELDNYRQKIAELQKQLQAKEERVAASVGTYVLEAFGSNVETLDDFKEWVALYLEEKNTTSTEAESVEITENEVM